MNESLKFDQLPFVRFDERHHIVSIPQKNVSPHFRRTGRNPRGISQPSAGMTGNIQFGMP